MFLGCMLLAAVSYLQCMIHVMLFPMLNVLYFYKYINTIRGMFAVSSMAVFCSSLVSCFLGMLLRCFLNDF